MTLTDTAFYTKKIGYGVVILVVVLIGCFIGRAFIDKVTEIINRPAAEAPQNGFGTLSQVVIKSALSNTTFAPEFSIETPSSALPTFSEYNSIINVYKIEEKPRDLASDQRARDTAKNLEFTTAPKVSNEIDYTWNENNRILSYNRQYGVFDYFANLPENTDKNNTRFTLDDAGLATDTIFAKIGITLGSSDTGITYKAIAEYVDYDPRSQTARKSTAGNDADFVRINVIRSIKPKPALTSFVDILDSNRNTGVVSIIMRNLANIDIKNVAKISYYNWSINSANGQTYSIISTSTAYQLLSSSKKTLISAKYVKDDTLTDEKTFKTITKARVLEVNLGYYQTNTVNTFIQPIYEFKCEGTTDGGENINLIYYVPAL